MNLTMFDMYVFGSIDSWIMTSMALGSICLVCAMAICINDKSDMEQVVEITMSCKVFLFFLCLSGIFFASAILLPNQKTIAMMYVVPKIANSEFMNKELPTDAKRLYSIAVKSLEESLVKTDKDSK